MTDQQNIAGQKLSFEIANAAFRTFVPIGDQVFDYMNALREAGFSAFDPWGKWVESFAVDEEELAVHQKCMIETAKNWIARPWPMRFSADELNKIYRSPYIQELADQRDVENGVPVNELSDHYGVESLWRREYDPCKRRFAQFQLSEHDKWQDQFEQTRQSQRQKFERETALHASELENKITLSMLRRGRFYKSIMEREAAPLGFTYDKKLSKFDYPVFSKSISEDWSICWTLEDPKQFSWRPTEGHFDPTLHIRSNSLRGKLNKAKPGDALFIRYRNVITSFFNSYWIFYSLSELETAIKAHLFLYGLMAPIVECGLKSVLETSTE